MATPNREPIHSTTATQWETVLKDFLLAQLSRGILLLTADTDSPLVSIASTLSTLCFHWWTCDRWKRPVLVLPRHTNRCGCNWNTFEVCNMILRRGTDAERTLRYGGEFLFFCVCDLLGRTHLHCSSPRNHYSSFDFSFCCGTCLNRPDVDHKKTSTQRPVKGSMMIFANGNQATLKDGLASSASWMRHFSSEKKIKQTLPMADRCCHWNRRARRVRRKTAADFEQIGRIQHLRRVDAVCQRQVGQSRVDNGPLNRQTQQRDQLRQRPRHHHMAHQWPVRIFISVFFIFYFRVFDSDSVVNGTRRWSRGGGSSARFSGAVRASGTRRDKVGLRTIRLMGQVRLTKISADEHRASCCCRC